MKNGFKIALFSVVAAAAVVFSALAFGLPGVLVLAMIPFLVWWLTRVFLDPWLGLSTAFVANYFVMGISRYVPGPLGLSIDSILVITYIAIIFSRRSFRPAARDLTLLAAIWYLYAVMELFNPLAVSREAWFYAMRGFSLYFLLVVPLTFILMNSRKDLNLVLKLWSIFTLIALAKGLVQFAGYLDYAEHGWLAAGGAKTHIINGRLRVFSFFTDAGQYGASMAMSGVVFTIIGFTSPGRDRLWYLFVALLGFIGMFISGTRGAIAVPLAGFLMYVLIVGKWKQIVGVAMILLVVFAFFNYTHIGDGNYQIARMRTAFNSKDASLQVRLNNQAKLKPYLADKPFGGGIGSAGNWGQRFSPNTFLANVPTDSWYVAIWAEQGVVGLSLHLFILAYFLVRGFLFVRRIRDPWLSARLKALLCGITGVVAASYSNGVLGQFPTGIIVYMGMAFIFMSKELDDETAS